ncbi:hypothetical protein [Antrihabitans spumae]|uniref:Uncharacterized protein n=1 Tax=Antrihabitans spumae TaxID=3373370 RepID=A0ABW7KWE7_9NOCA
MTITTGLGGHDSPALPTTPELGRGQFVLVATVFGPTPSPTVQTTGHESVAVTIPRTRSRVGLPIRKSPIVAGW